MNTKIFSIFLIPFLTSCNSKEGTLSTSLITTSSTYEIEHSYTEVLDKKIEWNSIFSIAKPAYFVYFYSKTCSHCKQLKNRIIEYSLTHDDIYFVEDSKNTVLLSDVSVTIGINSIETFGILGFPSLIKVADQKCILNVAGIGDILIQLSL